MYSRRKIITRINSFWFAKEGFGEINMILTDITERIKDGQKIVFKRTAVRDRLRVANIIDCDKGNVFNKIKIDKWLISIFRGCWWCRRFR